MSLEKTISERIDWRRRVQAATSLAFWTGTFPSLIGAVALVGVGLTLPILLPPLDALPSDQATINGIIGAVLQAQAAMMALSLAVLAFVVGGVQRREDLDDPLYEWFLSRAGVRPFFAFTAALTLGTGAAYFLARIWDCGATPNLILFAGGSLGLGVSVIIGFALWTLRVLSPGRYRQYKKQVTVSLADNAVKAHLRYKNPTGNYLTKSDMDQLSEAAQAAETAIQRIVDDAERAIRDSRYADFEVNIDTLSSIIERTVDLRSELRIGQRSLASLTPESSWPIGTVVGNGLSRLDRITQRERLVDYGLQVHYLRQDWMKWAVAKGDVGALEDVCKSLIAQYGLARNEGHIREQREIRALVRSLGLYRLRHLQYGIDGQLDVAQRRHLSMVLVRTFHRICADLAISEDGGELVEWLKSCEPILTNVNRADAVDQQIFAWTPPDEPSTKEYLLVSWMALAGLSMQCELTAAFKEIVRMWRRIERSLGDDESIASAIYWFGRGRAVEDLASEWRDWGNRVTFDDLLDWRGVFIGGFHPIVFHLWFGAGGTASGRVRRSVPNDRNTVDQMREVWDQHGFDIITAIPHQGHSFDEMNDAVVEWLGEG